MNTLERRKFILDKIKDTESVNTVDLSKELNVSTMTIRRDLKYFADQGVVTLTHGGAILNLGTLFENTVMIKQQESVLEKRTIAQYAASLIQDGDSILIDSGTTAREVSDFITTKKNLVILTHSLLVANSLAQSDPARLIMIPGVFREMSMAFLGDLACEFISNFKIDILFLGAEGLNATHGATVPNIEDAQTKRAFVRQAKKVVLLVDHTKIGKSFFMNIAHIKDIDLVITNKQANPKFINELMSLGLSFALV